MVPPADNTHGDIEPSARGNTRYRNMPFCQSWELGELLGELAGQRVSLAALRGQFRELLLRRAPTR
jgi:hypothetical protein